MREHESTVSLPVSRRRLLALAGVGTLGAVAGCLDDNDTPDAQEFTDEDACQNCGMLVTQQPGPSGQAFYDDHPDLEDGWAPFCSGTCTYGWTLEQGNAGNDPLVTYLTDYAIVDWGVSDDGDLRFISAHHDGDEQADATDLTMVTGSELRGSMGQDLIGFSDTDEAEALQDEYGGELVIHDEVTLELVDSLGGM
ncbi:nitrous oxide reductase accessory protein NosL [Natronosalvus vescus]|uniref:nitrous oxide reductase accessory protein NosL n=1 Tax=Natronosalvus vescus TaxID=2953881 RepID=UPI0020901A14|nr:nitrous oxide reductase accessory protein NosL [Natronosalvus vescus]